MIATVCPQLYSGCNFAASLFLHIYSFRIEVEMAKTDQQDTRDAQRAALRLTEQPFSHVLCYCSPDGQIENSRAAFCCGWFRFPWSWLLHCAIWTHHVPAWIPSYTLMMWHHVPTPAAKLLSTVSFPLFCMTILSPFILDVIYLLFLAISKGSHRVLAQPRPRMSRTQVCHRLASSVDSQHVSVATCGKHS